MDETRGIAESGSCPGAVDADTEWCWSSSTLYQYSTSDPDTRYTSPGTEASVRNRCIEGGYDPERDFITIEGLTLKYSNSNGYWSESTDNITFTNVTATYNWDNGIVTSGTSGDPITNITLDGCTLSFNGDTGAFFGNYVRNVSVTGCTINNNGQDSNDSENAGIRFANSIVVEKSKVYNNGRNEAGTDIASASGGYGIWFDTIGSNSGADPPIVRHNEVYNNVNAGIFMEQSQNLYTYGNVLYDNEYGIYLDTWDATYHSDNNVIYNNTIYNTTQYSILISGADTEGLLIKNNIVSTAGTHLFFNEDADDSVTIDYNLYYDSDLTNKFDWNNSHYSTLAAFQSASSQDGNSPSVSDPLFNDASNDDFTLKSDSPAIDVGTNLGETYDDALNPASVWPSFISTLDQDDYGPGWEIGAFIYKSGGAALSAPTGLRIVGAP
jgi:hypothetical protein